MTVWGVLISADAWQVIKDTLDDPGLDVGWVSFSPAEALAFLDEGGVDSLLVESRGDLLTGEIVDRADHSGVGVAALITGREAVSHASRLGVSWLVRTPRDLASDPNSPIRGTADRGARPLSRGRVIAVWGPVGAPGRTTISAALASLLARRGVKTVLVDGDQRSGSVAPALGLLDEVPGFVASCRLADRGNLTPDDLRRLAHRYDSGGSAFDVLTGVSATRVYPEVTADSVTEVMEGCRGVWEAVVVDVGSDVAALEQAPDASHIVATTLIAEADEVIALCRATPVGVARFARAYPDVVQRRDDRPVTPVVNGVDTSRRAMKDEATLREALRRFAGVNAPAVVPRDPDSCLAAEMAGVSVVDCAPKSPMVKAITPLSDLAWKHVDAVRRRAGSVAAVAVTGRTAKKRKAFKAPASLLERVRVLWRERLALR